ncbi:MULTISPECIES: sigma-70 family RNA polymerase sigma factor [unclassified Herbaspirillum]|uniref:sigma-70 family RNA polymerase sigma factor n=1 Tax=unclassified Herbaspirillum TaxID=2624150 RepID=UPI001150FE59|nr:MULTISPECIES: sigma-70 family RNA polymerase sigma factor [unclassified Herbaspirillum]MBB5391391.1 RNA polymerase sigma-70 factor (ECF subfamily) [Herbaspirillum sp. SJZ102]TQK12924.1 RNA polymerase sigma-70 factor (ECF subfamily) [Herbaspirillum sp. SJZ130]TQK14928.1 RNA polymerase sigma-70 factor (ECF subfamily) [Herbaspirillum sp. SJZ106]TWC67283.1 RNA polymerase sigma-70 factor (ECF subfamily) [Herbaspirillum sp. SJZ099]
MSNAGVHQQIGVLYSEHHNWLAGWLSQKLKCRYLGADLAQDTFVRLFSGRLPGNLDNPKAYLTTVAKGVVNTYLRRKNLEQAYLEALAAAPEPVQPSPEERLLVLEVLTDIDRILDGLPAKVKQVFLLAQLDGLPYADICDLLGVSLATVKRYMVKAYSHCLRVV